MSGDVDRRRLVPDSPATARRRGSSPSSRRCPRSLRERSGGFMHVRKLLPALVAALACRGRRRRAGRHQRRRHAVRDRPRRVARHPGEEHDRAAARRPSPAQKINWIILDDGSDTTKAVTNTRKLDLRGQGRRDRRLDDHAELAGDGRRRGRRRDADDLDGRVGADRRSGQPEDPAGCSRRRRTTR